MSQRRDLGHPGGGCGALDFADGGFADRIVEEFADVAQLVEQLIRNQQVSGSTPLVGSTKSITYGAFCLRLKFHVNVVSTTLV
jgi:hypothetical protein